MIKETGFQQEPKQNEKLKREEIEAPQENSDSPEQKEFSIKIRERDGVTIIDIQGSIIGQDNLDLKRAIDEQIASSEGKPKLLLNLADVPMMNRAGLNVIKDAYKSVLLKGGYIALLGLGTKQLLVMVELARIFQIYKDEDHAIESFNK